MQQRVILLPHARHTRHHLLPVILIIVSFACIPALLIHSLIIFILISLFLSQRPIVVAIDILAVLVPYLMTVAVQFANIRLGNHFELPASFEHYFLAEFSLLKHIVCQVECQEVLVVGLLANDLSYL